MYYWGGTQNTFGIVITHQIRQFKFHFSVDCILHCIWPGLEWAQTQPAFYFSTIKRYFCCLENPSYVKLMQSS